MSEITVPRSFFYKIAENSDNPFSEGPDSR